MVAHNPRPGRARQKSEHGMAISKSKRQLNPVFRDFPESDLDQDLGNSFCLANFLPEWFGHGLWGSENRDGDGEEFVPGAPSRNCEVYRTLGTHNLIKAGHGIDGVAEKREGQITQHYIKRLGS